MSIRASIKTVAVLLVAPLPALASTTTDTISQLAGLFYIVVGLALATACLLMLGGIILWLVRLGTFPTFRDEAIHLMEWAVATLFTLILVLGVVEFVQTHTSVVIYLIAVCIILLVGWLVATSVGTEEKKKESDE